VSFTKTSISNPIAVLVAVILALIFGFLSLDRLPVQLTPEVEKPEITISTSWRSAAPGEVESEIIEPQEKVFRGLPGMTEITSEASRGRGTVTITFVVGMDMQRALLEVLNRLNRVPFYPEDAEEPIISSVGGDSRAIAWFILKPIEGNDRHIASYQNFIEDVVQTRFERVQGVARSEVRGGRETEVRITFDPYKAASLNIQLPKVVSLVGGNKDVSAGSADVGKRRYVIRYAGKYDTAALEQMVLEWRDGRPIRLIDIARIETRLVDRTGFVIQNGQPAMAVNAHRETGVNVIQVMNGLREAREELSEGALKRAGLTIQQVYDETLYIDRSIQLVGNNLLLGVFLAIGVLWWFLRKFRATLMVALAIPVSIISTFVLLDMFGRTINVISLAGMAFAVGMVLDAAIVVLENITRLREKGKSSEDAALNGTLQVWGALLASTITTVAIFLPIVFLKDESGQLFADLALTIAVAIVFSLITAVTVLPTAAKKWLSGEIKADPHQHWWKRLTSLIMLLTNSPIRRGLWIVGLLTLPAYLAYEFKPPSDYLPTGNRNLVFAFVQAPPGVNVDTLEKEMGFVIADRMQPYVDGVEEPHVNDYFFVVFSTGAFMGVRAVDAAKTDQLVPLVNRVVAGFPDTIAFAYRTSLFGRGGGGNNIDVNIQGRNLESLLSTAQLGFREIRSALPGVRIRPKPGLDMAEPELRLVPDERKLVEAGLDRGVLANIIRAMGTGLYVGDYFDGDQRLDVILRAEGWENPEDLISIPIATPNSGIVPLGELVSLVRTAGPDKIRRIDRRRTVTLSVGLPKGMSIEEGIAVLKEKVEPKLMGMLPEDGNIQYSGTAEQLDVAQKNMVGSFILAVVILFLLMAALFRSFKDSGLVLLTIPLATVGGVLALNITNQSMDLLTMIGFIILLGLVVNNAILLVHQTRVAEREGLARRLAVQQAVNMRMRPIFMTTLTSIFGMLPLIFVSIKNNYPAIQEMFWFQYLPSFIRVAAGAELYSGLAVVIVGGMMVSTLFTLILLPSLLRIGEGKSENRVEVASKESNDLEVPLDPDSLPQKAKETEEANTNMIRLSAIDR